MLAGNEKYVYLHPYIFMVDIAQLVRAPDCGSGGRGFESHYSPTFYEEGTSINILVPFLL